MFTERYYLHVTYINTIVASIAKTHLTEKCPYVNTYPVPSFPSPTTKKINKKLKTQLKTRKRWKFTQHCIRSNKTPPFSFRIFVNFHPGTGGRERCKTFQQFRYDLRDERNAKKITSWRHPYGGSHNTIEHSSVEHNFLDFSLFLWFWSQVSGFFGGNTWPVVCSRPTTSSLCSEGCVIQAGVSQRPWNSTTKPNFYRSYSQVH